MPSRPSQDEAVAEERKSVYGDPKVCHTNIGKVWAGILGQHRGSPMQDIPADVVALMLAGFKLIRSANNQDFHEDNYIDARNYVGFAEQFKRDATEHSAN